jgi:hypothetical protein
MAESSSNTSSTTSADDASNATDDDDHYQDVSPGVQCPLCQKMCKNEVGLKIHNGHSHPDLKRAAIIAAGSSKRNSLPNSQPNLLSASSSQGFPASKAGTSRQQTSSQPTASSEFSFSIPASTPRQLSQPNTSTTSHVNQVPSNAFLGSQTSQGPKTPEEEEEQPTSPPPDEVRQRVAQFNHQFTILEKTPTFHADEFDMAVFDFQRYLSTVVHKIPGPQHPATKYWKMRQDAKKAKQADPSNTRKGYADSSNPQRDRMRNVGNARKQYERDLAQFYFKYRRRKCYQQVLHFSSGKKTSHIISLATVQEHIYSNNVANNCIRHDYPQFGQSKEPLQDFSLEEITTAIKLIKSDTAPGADHILMKMMKDLEVGPALKSIANIMLRRNYLPIALRRGRTILLHKGGDTSTMRNWRSITIFSIIRRIIEKCLDARIRTATSLSPHQRGFTSIPGCHVNSSIINASLKDAKTQKKTCVVVFLDVRKAFDSIGHLHIVKTLQSNGLPSEMSSLISTMLSSSEMQVEVGRSKTKVAPFAKGVPQGAPTSPYLFNLAIDHVFDELSEDANEAYAYRINAALPPTTVLGFADDISLTANSVSSARILIEQVCNAFHEIGLTINPEKSQAIVIQDGVHVQTDILFQDGMVLHTITSTAPDEEIRYLGCNFQDEIVFDVKKLSANIAKDVDTLAKSPLLTAGQKLDLLNQFIWPSFVYPLQSVPLDKIPAHFAKTMDTVIRSAVKQILGISHDIPDAQLYSPQRLRGLGIVCIQWEQYLQHLSICQKLVHVEDPILQATRNLTEEMEECAAQLNFPSAAIQSTSRQLRTALRDTAFETWSSHQFHGRGVALFKQYPKANRFMTTRAGLTAKEFKQIIKMNGNCVDVYAVPGRSYGDASCRHCKKNETLPHILGECERSLKTLVNTRHNDVCRIMKTVIIPSLKPLVLHPQELRLQVCEAE